MENYNSGLEKLTDTIGDVISGVPAPIRKNFFKACAQLCTAAVDVPTALFESKSAEIRATYEARVQIIKKEGESISEKIEVPKEYISKASEKYASKIIKEQLNLDEITLNAANNLADQNFQEDNQAEAELSDDWLNEFENHARLKSSEDMKLIFGKILSGEISKPGSFSIRTIRLISQLDTQAANLFQLLCSLSISMQSDNLIHEARVVSFGGDAGSNSLAKFGLSFGNLVILEEYGLIISQYNSSMSYSPCIANEKNLVQASFCFENKHYGLVPTDDEKYDKDLRLSGVALTKSAKELINTIPLKEVDNYKTELEEFLSKKHLKLVEINV